MTPFLLGIATGLLFWAASTWISQWVRGSMLMAKAEWRELGAGFDEDEEIKLTFSDGRERVFRGGCTVWSEYPSGRPCSIEEEHNLLQITTREKWKRNKT